MILDRLATFCESQSLAEAGPNGSLFRLSTNVVDLGAISHETFAAQKPLAIDLVIATSFTAGAGAPRLQFGPVFSDTPWTAVDGTGATNTIVPILTGFGQDQILSGAGTGAAALVAGFRMILPIPPMSSLISGQAGLVGSGPSKGMPLHLKRYLGLIAYQAVTTGAYFSAGAISAYLVTLEQAKISLQYPNAY